MAGELTRDATAGRGLTSREAALRLRRDGPNALPAPRPPSPVIMLLRQLAGFFAPLLWAVTAEIVVLFLFIGLPPLADPPGGGFPSALGWAVAVTVIPVVLAVDAGAEQSRARRRRRRSERTLPCLSERP